MKKILVLSLIGLTCSLSFAQIHPNEHKFKKEISKLSPEKKVQVLENCWNKLTADEKREYLEDVEDIKNTRKSLSTENRIDFKEKSFKHMNMYEVKCGLSNGKHNVLGFSFEKFKYESKYNELTQEEKELKKLYSGGNINK